MKKQIYTKLLFLFALLLTVLFTGAATAKAQVEFGPSDFSAADQAATSASKGGVSIAITQGTITADQIRIFKGQKITFTSTSEIASIEFTCTASGTSKYGPGCFSTPGVGSYEFNGNVGTWTGSANEVVFTASSNQVRATKIVVTVNGSGDANAVATPEISGTTPFVGSTDVSITCSTDGANIYYTLNGETPTTASTAYTGSFTINETTTVKAIAVKDDKSSEMASATYTIVNHAGTAEDPYSVADAFTAIDANVGMTGVYVQGIVSEIVTEYSEQYENITFDISDGTPTSEQLRAFRCVSGGAEVSGIQEGDEVVVKGNLTLYHDKNVDIYEFTQGNQLVSLVRPVSEEPSIVVATPSEVDYTGEENGEIEVTYNNIDNVSAGVQWFESDGSTPATYDWITAEINANNNISYHIEKNTGAARTAYLKVYVNDVYSDLITITQKKAPEQFTVTYFVAGEEFTTAECLEGEALDLPNPGARGGYQFAGWSTVENAAAPKFWADDAAVNSNLTLYAIFVKGVGGTVYTKVTNTEDITDGQYLIVYEADKLAFDGSRETLDASGNTIGVEITDNTIASSDAVNAATFTIDTTHGTIQSASGLYIGQTSYANGLKTSDSSSYTNTFSIDDEDNVVITAVVGEQNPTLRYNDASGDNNLRFRYYKSGQKAIQLYKRTASATYTLNEPEVSITTAANATWVAPAKVWIKSDDVQVYTVEYIADKSKVYKHKVADKVIPANAAVLLTSDAATTVEVAVTDKPATAYNELVNDHKNHLQGSDGTVPGGDNIYCLAEVDNVLGFYRVDKDIKVPAGKAYLDTSLVGGESLAPSYLWFNGDTTAIDSLTTDTAAGNESGEIYSLTGQRVGKNYRGIVIMNGRKVLKK